ncbi:putative polysaccharide biosynthesis protein [Bacillus horti]|uniref:PST family polysaccharide transporter n=1 Tax=Caldalkalibacillus horti TaxID=77523 RepID=A0ABT9W2V6_9BACI|nr:polysaccharide biosynthesis protein [Bacillus horti]MDQ0167586.1 PST family polysaccharide transporter [Bacillus horti]
MSGQDKTKLLLKGTAILAIAALLSKMLGVVYRIPYQNITGNLGFYVYQQVYPLYSLLLILATAGFPIAVSKLVAERLALGDQEGAKRVFRVSTVVLSLTGVFFFLLLYFTAPVIAGYMEDERLIMPIRSVSYALLVVPVMAAIRGYFQGHQNMIPTAVSQIVEQIIRVVTILALSYWFIQNSYDEYYAGAGAVFGAFTGAVAALLVLLLFWKRVKKTTQETVKEGQQTKVFEQESAWVLMKKILYLAIPICLGAMVLPLFQLVDAFSFVKILINSGWEAELSRELKGIFDRGQPLVQFAAFFATALSLALVPSISEAHARKDTGLIAARSEIAMRLTLFIGLGASFGLATLAGPVNIMLYKTDEGTTALAILAFTTVFSTLGITSGAILQGLGQVIIPARNLFIGVIVKTILNILLIPIWGIEGAAAATVAAYAVATILNLIALYQYTGLQVSFNKFFSKPVFAVLAMTLFVWLSMKGLSLGLANIISHERLLYSFVALVAVLIGVAVFGVALLRFGAVTKEELVNIPKINKLIPILQRLKLLK